MNIRLGLDILPAFSCVTADMSVGSQSLLPAQSEVIRPFKIIFKLCAQMTSWKYRLPDLCRALIKIFFSSQVEGKMSFQFIFDAVIMFTTQVSY